MGSQHSPCVTHSCCSFSPCDAQGLFKSLNWSNWKVLYYLNPWYFGLLKPPVSYSSLPPVSWEYCPSPSKLPLTLKDPVSQHDPSSPRRSLGTYCWLDLYALHLIHTFPWAQGDRQEGEKLVLVQHLLYIRCDVSHMHVCCLITTQTIDIVKFIV